MVLPAAVGDLVAVEPITLDRSDGCSLKSTPGIIPPAAVVLPAAAAEGILAAAAVDPRGAVVAVPPAVSSAQ